MARGGLPAGRMDSEFQNLLLTPGPNQLMMHAVSSLNEGRIMIVVLRGTGCGGRGSVVARFWRADERC
jgi:hypothetical protein